MIERIHINPSSEVPLFRQLSVQIKGLIAEGTLRPGDALPGVRAMAKALGINPMTISKAVSQLTEEGWLTYQRGQPSKVASLSDKDENWHAEWLEPALKEVVTRAKQLQLDQQTVVQKLAQLWKETP